MSVLYGYSAEALDLALRLRVSCMDIQQPVVQQAVQKMLTRIDAAVSYRAAHSAGRSGTTAFVEDELQSALVATLSQDPLLWDGSPAGTGIVAVHHSPLGFGRTPFQAAQAKRAGASAGWPDLDIRMKTAAGPRALLLELKTVTGRLSTEQRAAGERLRAAGFDCRVAFGFSSALATVLEVLRG